MKIKKLKMERVRRGIDDAIGSVRGIVMDTFESELGGSPNWQVIRARLLRAFGDRGLSARIAEILDAEFGSEVEND